MLPSPDDSSVVLQTGQFTFFVGPNGTIIWGSETEPGTTYIGGVDELPAWGAMGFYALGLLAANLIMDIIEQCGFLTSLEIVGAGLGDMGCALDVIACIATLRY